MLDVLDGKDVTNVLDVLDGKDLGGPDRSRAHQGRRAVPDHAGGGSSGREARAGR